MNENDKLNNEINYYSSFARAFTVEEVVDFSVEVLSPLMVRERIFSDDRFIAIPRLNNDELFISKAVLTEWLIYLNVHLAKIKSPQLTKKQLSFFVDSLISSDGHNDTIDVVTKFGEKVGLVSFSSSSHKYTFPIAHVLSFVNIRSGILLDILAYVLKNTDISFEKQADEILEKVLLELDTRERFVMQAREGLFDVRKHTLFEVGNVLGITRERVRQLEMSIHNRRVLIRPFLTALLQDIVARGGKVLFDTPPHNTNARSLFARYIGIPVANISDLNLNILGISNVSLDKRLPHLNIEKVIECVQRQL